MDLRVCEPPRPAVRSLGGGWGHPPWALPAVVTAVVCVRADLSASGHWSATARLPLSLLSLTPCVLRHIGLSQGVGINHVLVLAPSVDLG